MFHRHTLCKLPLVALSAVLLIWSSACGTSAPAPAASSSGITAVLLESPQGGFSLKYPAGFVKIEPDIKDQPGLVYQVLLADPTGAKSGESALDVIGITVREMSKVAKPGDLKKHRAEFEGMMGQLIGDPEALRLSGPSELTELGGRSALKVGYVCRVDGVDVATVAYLVPRGDRVYWVTGQASRDTWDTTGKMIGAAISTIEFVGGGDGV